MLNFNKQIYLDLLRAQGLSAALTALHRDTSEWEFKTFEGEKGYQPEMWKDLEAVRRFSRELWEIALQDSTAKR